DYYCDSWDTSGTRVLF
nr:immunoglobulin light chain junction region [Macaca mulatta]MOW37260.1 immunoglobulin light chain junction region [Macaca mulatta]MOW37780.1 immunoglobulin light chain junction region [Macaca mulatta]